MVKNLGVMKKVKLKRILTASWFADTDADHSGDLIEMPTLIVPTKHKADYGRNHFVTNSIRLTTIYRDVLDRASNAAFGVGCASAHAKGHYHAHSVVTIA